MAHQRRDTRDQREIVRPPMEDDVLSKVFSPSILDDDLADHLAQSVGQILGGGRRGSQSSASAGVANVAIDTLEEEVMHIMTSLQHGLHDSAGRAKVRQRSLGRLHDPPAVGSRSRPPELATAARSLAGLLGKDVPALHRRDALALLLPGSRASLRPESRLHSRSGSRSRLRPSPSTGRLQAQPQPGRSSPQAHERVHGARRTASPQRAASPKREDGQADDRTPQELQAFVERLEERLSEATQRAKFLEEHVAAMRGLGLPAQTEPAQAAPSPAVPRTPSPRTMEFLSCQVSEAGNARGASPCEPGRRASHEETPRPSTPPAGRRASSPGALQASTPEVLLPHERVSLARRAAGPLPARSQGEPPVHQAFHEHGAGVGEEPENQSPARDGLASSPREPEPVAAEPVAAEPPGRGAVEPRSQEAVERSQAAAGKPAGADDDGLWEFVVQGRLTSAGHPEASHKDLTCFPGRATERVQARGIAYLCARGRRLDQQAPNQDDFLVAMCRCGDERGRVALYGVFDGHGPCGHLHAAFTRGFLPERIFADPTLLARPAEVLRSAFAEAQASLLQQSFAERSSPSRPAASPSGTTATVALVLSQLPRRANGHSDTTELGTWIYVAHVGDSRVVLGSRTDSDGVTATALTRDHRPSDEDETSRVMREGGEVRKSQAGGCARVFAAGLNHPGLPLTRALGEAVAAGCGVSAEPEISEHQVQPGRDALLVLGTDALFEFCGDDEVVEGLLRLGIDGAALEGLCQESRRRWALNSYNETVDDTTAVAVDLRLSTA